MIDTKNIPIGFEGNIASEKNWGSSHKATMAIKVRILWVVPANINFAIHRNHKCSRQFAINRATFIVSMTSIIGLAFILFNVSAFAENSLFLSLGFDFQGTFREILRVRILRDINEARKLKALEAENAKLKRVVTDQDLNIFMLKDVN